MRKKTILLSIAIVFPMIIMLGMSIVPIMTYLFGEEIILETVPVDPRDIFRGDYVFLNFVINEVDKDLFPEELNQREMVEKYRHKKLYAILKKNGNVYEVERMTLAKPDHEYYLRANINLYIPLNEMDWNKVHVEYDIDRFFVPENTGKHLEEMSREGNLLARIKIWHGYPLLMEIYPKEG